MRVNFNSIAFDRSFGKAAQLPGSTLPEVSFAGRSNVGKSSLINRLFGRKSLAKVSQTPGKTATINFYANPAVTFVDLPGYGYAQKSKVERASWSSLMEGYFQQERRFGLVCVLIDIRLPPQKLDVDMVHWMQELKLPYALIFTKADKLGSTKLKEQTKLLCEAFGASEVVPHVVTSSEKGTGIEDLRKLIQEYVDAS